MTKEEILAEASKKIVRNLTGSYAHNVISSVLRRVQIELGTKEANSLVHKHNLQKLFSIYPEEVSLDEKLKEDEV